MWRQLAMQAAVGLVFVTGLTGTCNGGGTESEAQEAGDDLMATEGESCASIDDCSGYLRCIERTCEVPPAVDGDATESTPVATFRGGSEGAGDEVAEFYLELATTPAQRERGLMFRQKMADGWGMLFVYPAEGARAFWMKNTYIPLDMIFIGGDGQVVDVVRGAEPETQKLRRSDAPARYVLEVEAGVADQKGIAPGAVMELEGVDQRHQPSR